MNHMILTLASLFGYCLAETLIWEDNFDKLDFSKWEHELTLGGGGNWEFEAYRNNRTNSFVKDGVLYIQPTLTKDALGLQTMTSGAYAIWGSTPADTCTSNAFYGCERNAAASGNVINPIMSARLRTVRKFSFKYGRVEITAQLPKGDWIWPAIWLLPENAEYGTWPASGEIDLVESRGNDASCSVGGNNKFGSSLHWGPNWDQDMYPMTTAQYTHPSSLGDAMHVYGLVWTENRRYTYIDNESNIVLDVDMSSTDFFTKGGWKGQDNPWVNEPKNAPFNREFYLILNVAVGGTGGYFPEGQCGKTWSNNDPHSVNAFWNSWGAWYPTWKYPETNQSALKVDSIKVWSFDPKTTEATQ